jgi:hypothetical protein
MPYLNKIIVRNDLSMPNSSSNPIHELWITWSWEQPPVLLLPLRLLLLPSHKSLVQLLLLLLLSSPLFFLPSLPLRTVVQQESQCTAKCQDEQRLEDV